MRMPGLDTCPKINGGEHDFQNPIREEVFGGISLIYRCTWKCGTIVAVQSYKGQLKPAPKPEMRTQ